MEPPKTPSLDPSRAPPPPTITPPPAAHMKWTPFTSPPLSYCLLSAQLIQAILELMQLQCHPLAPPPPALHNHWNSTCWSTVATGIGSNCRAQSSAQQRSGFCLLLLGCSAASFLCISNHQTDALIPQGQAGFRTIYPIQHIICRRSNQKLPSEPILPKNLLSILYALRSGTLIQLSHISRQNTPGEPDPPIFYLTFFRVCHVATF